MFDRWDIATWRRNDQVSLQFVPLYNSNILASLRAIWNSYQTLGIKLFPQGVAVRLTLMLWPRFSVKRNYNCVRPVLFSGELGIRGLNYPSSLLLVILIFYPPITWISWLNLTLYRVCWLTNIPRSSFGKRTGHNILGCPTFWMHSSRENWGPVEHPLGNTMFAWLQCPVLGRGDVKRQGVGTHQIGTVRKAQSLTKALTKALTKH